MATAIRTHCSLDVDDDVDPSFLTLEIPGFLFSTRWGAPFDTPLATIPANTLSTSRCERRQRRLPMIEPRISTDPYRAATPVDEKCVVSQASGRDHYRVLKDVMRRTGNGHHLLHQRARSNVPTWVSEMCFLMNEMKHAGETFHFICPTSHSTCTQGEGSRGLHHRHRFCPWTCVAPRRLRAYHSRNADQTRPAHARRGVTDVACRSGAS